MKIISMKPIFDYFLWQASIMLLTDAQFFFLQHRYCRPVHFVNFSSITFPFSASVSKNSFERYNTVLLLFSWHSDSFHLNKRMLAYIPQCLYNNPYYFKTQLWCMKKKTPQLFSGYLNRTLSGFDSLVTFLKRLTKPRFPVYLMESFIIVPLKYTPPCSCTHVKGRCDFQKKIWRQLRL